MQHWNTSEAEEEISTVHGSKPDPMPVEWEEFGDRGMYFADYIPIGSCPGTLTQSLFYGNYDYTAKFPDGESGTHGLKEVSDPAGSIRKILSQTVLLMREDRKRLEIEDSRFVASILEKILMRGNTPLPTFRIEREALKLHGLSDSVEEMEINAPEVGWKEDLHADPARILGAMIDRPGFELDRVFDYGPINHNSTLGSREESKFLTEWVPRELGESAGHWFIPQASLGALLESVGKSGDNPVIESRRVDFLFCHPFAPSLIIEIDGFQHQKSTKVDASRDRDVGQVGIEVVRISTEELEQNMGPGLNSIRRRLQGLFSRPMPSEEDQQLADFIISCTEASKIQLAVAKAVWRGWLRPGRSWKVRIKGTYSPSAVGIVDILGMLEAIDILYGTQVSPSSCVIELDDGNVYNWLFNASRQERLQRSENVSEEIDCFTVTSEIRCGPFHIVGDNNQSDCIIRSIYLPVDLVAAPDSLRKQRRSMLRDYQDQSRVHKALRLFLGHLYRKRDFREGQVRALINALSHIDTIVLLPTGGGKSIIYQLAGMLMPGVTLVIDPLIALMEDQIEGLESYGIDRAIAIFSTEQSIQEQRIRTVEKGNYQFILISPERLQNPRFREAINSLAGWNSINLAVIDEAHCVSEWGHDFRPSYLSLTNNLRTLSFSEDDTGPPLLALTGTASRAVLRDMINDLEINKDNSDSLIRTESFDRKEIKFKVIRIPPSDAVAKLKGELRRLPAEWGLPVAEYYRSRGRKTNSGIIFVPTVGGKKGIDSVRGHIHSAIRAETTIYSGKAPNSSQAKDWNQTKRINARKFKQNQIPVLVATKAYGMGIDKPNIRYTIHYGVPSSLEQYYQEAGRAGRDKQEAQSILIFQELEASRSDQLLDPDLDLDDLRNLHKEATSNYDLWDDVTRAIYFHLNAFPGTQIEIKRVTNFINDIIQIESGIPILQSFNSNTERENLEKSIYRLYKLGFVRDYTLDFGSKKFEIRTNQFDFQMYCDRFLSYVRSVAPGKIGPIQRRVREINPVNRSKALTELASFYIEFTYDEIERARRRAIQEAILLARQSKSDSEVRTRLLDYLQEGLGYEKIDELLQREQVDLHEWIDLVDKVENSIEAGELRGMCIRALESSADHPGLLLIRGVVEALASDYYWNVASTSITRAIIAGIEKYDITPEHAEDTVQRLFRLTCVTDTDTTTTAIKTGQLESALVLALRDVAESGSSPDYQFAKEIALMQSYYSKNSDTRVVLDQFRLDQLLKNLEDVWDNRIQDSERIHDISIQQ